MVTLQKITGVSSLPINFNEYFFSHRVWDKIKVSREIGTKKQTGRDNTWNQDRFQQGMEREGITLIVQIALKA